MLLDQRTHGSSSVARALILSHQACEHRPLDLVISQPRGQMRHCLGGHCITLATQCRKLTSCVSTELPAIMAHPAFSSCPMQRKGFQLICIIWLEQS